MSHGALYEAWPSVLIVLGLVAPVSFCPVPRPLRSPAPPISESISSASSVGTMMIATIFTVGLRSQLTA